MNRGDSDLTQRLAKRKVSIRHSLDTTDPNAVAAAMYGNYGTLGGNGTLASMAGNGRFYTGSGGFSGFGSHGGIGGADAGIYVPPESPFSFNAKRTAQSESNIGSITLACATGSTPAIKLETDFDSLIDASPYNRRKRELQKGSKDPRILKTQFSEPEEILQKSVLVSTTLRIHRSLSITQPELLSEIEYIDATTTTTTTSSISHAHSIEDDTTLAEVGDEFSDSPEYSRDSNFLLVPSEGDLGPDSSECDLSTGTVIFNSPGAAGAGRPSTCPGRPESISPSGTHLSSTFTLGHDDTDNSIGEEEEEEDDEEELSPEVDFGEDDRQKLLGGNGKVTAERPRPLRRPSMEAATASSVFIFGLDSVGKKDSKLSVKPLNHSNSLFDCSLSRESSPKPPGLPGDGAGSLSSDGSPAPTSPAGMHPLYQHHPHHRHHHQHQHSSRAGSPRRRSTSGSPISGSLESNGSALLNSNNTNNSTTTTGQ